VNIDQVRDYLACPAFADFGVWQDATGYMWLTKKISQYDYAPFAKLGYTHTPEVRLNLRKIFG
jgi:hypothetical protein